VRRPAFQFYPADWKSNANLRRSTFGARGAWMDVICLLHDSDEYGLVRWPLKEISHATGVPLGLLRELVTKGVLKGSDRGLTEPYLYTPRSGRKDGETVTLVPAQPGPVWYSSRMVRDEYVRTIRGDGTRFGDTKGETPKPAPKPPLSDGPTSSSSSSAAAIDDDDRADALARAPEILARVCEILRVELQADPGRLTWQRQIEEMLRDAIPEADIIRAADLTRVAGVLNLKYLRSVALSRPWAREPVPFARGSPQAASDEITNPGERALAAAKKRAGGTA
jgi:hypothetical protein